MQAKASRAAENSGAEVESGTGVFYRLANQLESLPARFLKPALAFVAIAPRKRSRHRA